MADVTKVRKIEPAQHADFDEQLWPINCTILILAGFVAGIVIATSSFDDPRILYNGWARLVSVGLMVVLLFLGVLWLHARTFRRLQLCVLLSLLAHLCLFIFLYQQTLPLPFLREARSTPQVTDPQERITVPDYHWQQIEPTETRQSFEEPAKTEDPKEADPEESPRQEVTHDVPLKERPPVVAEVPQTQQPNPVELRRAELSAPRRAEVAGGQQLSRQPWRHRPEPNEPIPEPEIRPQGQQTTAALRPQPTPIQRQQAQHPAQERRTFEEPASVDRRETAQLARRATQPQPIPDVPTTPSPTRQMAALAETPRTEATAPQPVKVVQPTRPDELRPAIAEVPRQVSPTPLPTIRAPVEPAPTTAATAQAARAAVRSRQPETRPELAQAPRAALSRQLSQTALPATAREAQPQATTATAQSAAPLTAAATPIQRQQGTTPPVRVSVPQTELARAAASQQVVRAHPRRSQNSPAPSPETRAPQPARVARQPSPAEQFSPAQTVGPAPSTPAPSAQPVLPATGPSSSGVAKAATSPGMVRQQTPGIGLPSLTEQAQLPASVARRATASQEQPAGADATASRPTTLARAEQGANIPSTAVAVEVESVLTPPAAGTAPGSRLEASSNLAAVAYAGTQAPRGSARAAAGGAEMAVGSAQVNARIGQARAAGLGEPSVNPNASVPRVARADSGSSVGVTRVSEIAPVPAVPTGRESGGPPTFALDARGTAAARSGRNVLPTSRPMPGSGSESATGTSGAIGVAQLTRVTRHESQPNQTAGGGTPHPARSTTGRALAADVRPEAAEVVAAPGGAGNAPGTPLEANVGGQHRQVAGLPGSRTSQTATGSIESLAEGAPLPAAMARRALASQTGSGSPGLSPNASATLVRARSGADLPSAAIPVEQIPAVGAGGVTAGAGSLPSTLEAGRHASVQRTAAAGVPSGRTTTPAGSAEFAAGEARAAVLAGQIRADAEGVPALAMNAATSTVGRSAMAPAIAGAVAGTIAEPIPDQPSTAAAPGDGAQEPTGGPSAQIARATATGLPTGAPGPTPGSESGGAQSAVGTAQVSRAVGTEMAEASVGSSAVAGPARTMGRIPLADVAADVPGAAAGAAEPQQTSGEPQGPIQAAAFGPQRQMAGLPGALNPRTPVDAATTAGPAATSPGVTAGPRRTPQGTEQGPTLAAQVGGGPVRKTEAPGLPRGLDEVIEPLPEIAGGAAQAGVPDVAADSRVAELTRREGGLPVQVAAITGPGGLSSDPSPEVGLPSRRARPESEMIHNVSRRFVLERSGGELAIDGAAAEPTELFRHRDVGQRSRVARERGGSEGTERAVESGLDFFARLQFPDGHWSLHELPPGLESDDPALGQMQSDTAATGLALLTYLGGGYTHLDDKHKTIVRKGVDWLVQRQKPDGDLYTGGSRYTWLYSHGIASIALCEAYGMTQDPELREPARKAIEFIIKAQHPTRGGWRYEPGKETDTSVSGWMLMALKSAQMAGLEVPAEVFQKVGRWLDTAQAPEGGGRYVYNPHALDTLEQREGRRPSMAMTAESMLMRMYLGRTRDDPGLIEGAEWLKQNLPQVGTEAQPLRDAYYWYYATQAMFQLQRDFWTSWNERLRPLIESSQVQSGPLSGSWHPDKPVPDRWGHAGGRLYVTALHLLMLEVYYRHLPLFQELSK